MTTSRQEPRLKIGLGRTVITPPLDTPMAGYYYPRMPAGVHDDLYAKALAFDNGTEQMILVVCDLLKVPPEVVRNARSRIQAELRVPSDHVLISAAHSHTGPLACFIHERAAKRGLNGFCPVLA